MKKKSMLKIVLLGSTVFVFLFYYGLIILFDQDTFLRYLIFNNNELSIYSSSYADYEGEDDEENEYEDEEDDDDDYEKENDVDKRKITPVVAPVQKSINSQTKTGLDVKKQNTNVVVNAISNPLDIKTFVNNKYVRLVASIDSRIINDENKMLAYKDFSKILSNKIFMSKQYLIHVTDPVIIQQIEKKVAILSEFRKLVDNKISFYSKRLELNNI